MPANLPQILPAHRHRLTFQEPRFISYAGEWALIGPDTSLRAGSMVTVARRGAREVTVKVGDHVADYTVHRRVGSYLREAGPAVVRYVVARIVPAPRG